MSTKSANGTFLSDLSSNFSYSGLTWDTGVPLIEFAKITLLHVSVSKYFYFTSHLRLKLQESLLALHHWSHIKIKEDE